MKKILIVDDSNLQIEMLKEEIQPLGFEIISAENGEDGLKLAKQENPDLIIIDLIMPKMDGLEVCGWLKKNPETKTIPVIMMSAADRIEVRETCRICGVDGYIVKPIQIEEIKSKIRELL